MMVDEPHCIFVVDDDDGFRRSTERLLRIAGYQVRGYASALDLADEACAVPTCVVLDVRMPGMNGLDLQRHLAGRGLEIVFMTGHGDIAMSVRAMKAGAVEFLTKPFSDRALLEAVETALQRSRTGVELAELRRRLGTLTRRENDVMQLVVEGLLNKQVAAALGISEITVKLHRHNVMAKMQASSLAELVRVHDRIASDARGDSRR